MRSPRELAERLRRIVLDVERDHRYEPTNPEARLIALGDGILAKLRAADIVIEDSQA